MMKRRVTRTDRHVAMPGGRALMLDERVVMLDERVARLDRWLATVDTGDGTVDQRAAMADGCATLRLNMTLMSEEGQASAHEILKIR